MKTNGVLFLASMSHDLCYRTAQPFPKKPNSIDHEIKLHELHSLCKKGGFLLNETHADQQFKKTFESFRHKFNPRMKANYANTEENVTRAERNVQDQLVIKF